MSDSSLPEDRTFSCEGCGGEIRIPYALPPTSAPCPHCGKEITSPPVPEPPGGSGRSETAAEPAGPDVPPPPKTQPPSGNAGAVPAEAERSAEGVAGSEAGVDTAAPGQGGQAVSGADFPADVDSAADSIPDDALPGDGVVPARRAINPVLPFVGVIAVIVLLLVVAMLLNKGRRPAPDAGQSRTLVERNRFLREGWKRAAAERLDAFIGASDLEEKARNVVGGVSRISDMRELYGAAAPSDADTPASSFSHFDLEEFDKERGIFLMRYERPAQFDIREFFRPVAPIEVQYRVEQPDLLLSSVASLDNFSMEPVRVMAFFKLEGDGLLLDWDVFVQTKNRTLLEFVSSPQPGEVKSFRVVVNEDVQSTGQPDLSKVRYYRFADPAHTGDYVKVPVAVSSREGRILQSLNWIGMPGRGIPSQTATVRLAWAEGPDPQVELREVVCWEFLGLGGERGNAIPGEPYRSGPDGEEDDSSRTRASEEAGATAGSP
jgi:hypothetical protein